MKIDMPAAIPIAVQFMRNSFGGTEVEIISEAYRLEPTEDAPAGALGCDIVVKIPALLISRSQLEIEPIKAFLRNSIAEDIAWHNLVGAPNLSQMVADGIVYELLNSEFEKLKKN